MKSITATIILLLYGYAGVSSYTSTLTATTQDTLSALGLYRKNDRRIAYVDNSQLTNLLLNVKYDFYQLKNLPVKNC